MPASSSRSSVRARQARAPGRRLATALVARPETSPTAGADRSGVTGGGSIVHPVGRTLGQATPTRRLRRCWRRSMQRTRLSTRKCRPTPASDALRALVRSLAPLAGRKTVSSSPKACRSPTRSVRSLAQPAERSQSAQRGFLHVRRDGPACPESAGGDGACAFGPQFGDGFAVGQLRRHVGSTAQPALNGPTHGLAELANSTGGQYISNTNDLTSAFVRVNEDRRSYYMLSYSSSNPAMDGSYRIDQRQSASTRRHRSRTAWLRRRRRRSSVWRRANTKRRRSRRWIGTSVSHGVSFRLQALSTPMPGQPGMVSLIASIDASALTFTVDDATARYSGQVTVLARMKTQIGRDICSREASTTI